jgi:hypothetical protein
VREAAKVRWKGRGGGAPWGRGAVGREEVGATVCLFICDASF